jgi:hypothetical protein
MPMSKPKRRAKSKSATSIVKPETKVEIPKEILVEFVESKVKLKEIKFIKDIKVINVFGNHFRINVWHSYTEPERLCATNWIEHSYFVKYDNGTIVDETLNK